METRFQSSEVRIPKYDRAGPATGTSTFKSSFARSLSYSSQNKSLCSGLSCSTPSHLDISSTASLNRRMLSEKDNSAKEFMQNLPPKQAVCPNQQFYAPMQGHQYSTSCDETHRQQVGK